jgi:phosphopantetheinyl transferase (holo-ACP synthase)
VPEAAVGDDLVDLGRARTHGRAGDGRLLERVLTREERELVTLAASRSTAGVDAEGLTAADRLLWALWAAKEAAFKVHTKLLGAPPPFVHADYRVYHTPPARAGRSGMVEVSWGDGACRVAVTQRDGSVHAVAVPEPGGSSGGLLPNPVTPTGDGADGTELPTPALPHGGRLVAVTTGLDEAMARWGRDEQALRARFSPAEWGPVHSTASALVRLGARRLAAGLLQVEENTLAILCAPGSTGRRPPYLEVEGRRSKVSVSFTHDGSHLGWAVRVPPESAGG